MNKKGIGILLFSIALFIGSTKTQAQIELAKDLGEWKTPTWKAPQDIQKIAAKNSATYDALYYIENFRDWVSLSQNQLIQFPGIYLFDKNGKPIKVFLGSNCPTKAINYIYNLDQSSNTVKSDSSLTSFKDFLNRIAFLDGQKGLLKSKNKNYDYIFLYTWASFIPKKAKEVFETAKKLKKEENLVFKIISVNEDFMAKWLKNPKKFVGKKVDINNFNKYSFEF